jgi:hypothetical protein
VRSWRDFDPVNSEEMNIYISSFPNKSYSEDEECEMLAISASEEAKPPRVGKAVCWLYDNKEPVGANTVLVVTANF